MVQNNQVIVIFLICGFDFVLWFFFNLYLFIVSLYLTFSSINPNMLHDRWDCYNAIAWTMSIRMEKYSLHLLNVNHKHTKAFYIFFWVSKMNLHAVPFNRKWIVNIWKPVLSLLKKSNRNMQKLDEFWNLKLYFFLNCIHHMYVINGVLTNQYMWLFLVLSKDK